MLFEISAEVLIGLRKAFDDYEQENDRMEESKLNMVQVG